MIFSLYGQNHTILPYLNKPGYEFFYGDQTDPQAVKNDTLKLHDSPESSVHLIQSTRPQMWIILLMFGVIAGEKHMNHMKILGIDNIIRKIFNLTMFPVGSTCSMIFKLFTHRNCNEIAKVKDEVRRDIWKKKWFGRITLELDS